MLKGFTATEFGRNKESKPKLLLKGSFPMDFLSPRLSLLLLETRTFGTPAILCYRTKAFGFNLETYKLERESFSFY